MNTPPLHLGCLAFLLAVSCLLAPPGAPARAAEAGTAAPEGTAGCFRISIEPPIRWISSLAPRPDGSGWVLADTGNGLLRLLDPEGRPAGEVARPGRGALEFTKPSHVEALGDRLLLQDGNEHLLLLDAAATPLRGLEVTEPAAAGAPRVAALIKVAAADPGTAYAFGTLLQPDGSWWTGFYRLEVPPSGQGVRVERLLPIPTGPPQGDFYTLLYPLVAGAPDGRGYLVRMSEEVHLVEATPGEPLRRLEAFPGGFRQRPRLPALRIDTVALVGHALQRTRMVAGIAHWHGRVWVLTREVAADGDGSLWRLHAIDPRRDRLTHSVTLPTRASDLSFSPGPERWGFLEKQPMRAVGEQPVDALLLVPAPWIEDADGHLFTAKSPVCPHR